MMCRYIIAVLIIIPHNVNSLFTQNVANIKPIRNITCQLDNETSSNDFQLCAIRSYYAMINGNESMLNLYDGLRYANTFRPYINNNCPEFTSGINNDTGSGKCTARSFEWFSRMELCICAMDNCNSDHSTCEQSSMNEIPSLASFMPDLNSIIQCDDTLNASDTCTEHPYMNTSICEAYVMNNSVLCSITTTGTQATQKSLISDNYEAFLDEQIYQVKSATNNPVGTSYDETKTSVYYKYFTDFSGSNEGCACTTSSFCNQNLSSCLSQSDLQIITTISSFSSSNTTGSDNASESTSMETTTTTTPAISVQTSELTPTTNITATMSTPMIASTVKPEVDSIETSESILTTNTTTTMSTGSTKKSESTSTINAEAITLENSITTQSISNPTTPLPIIIPSSTGRNIVKGETGLGRSATAGIACGIIFSALIITAEIVFFKFFYSGSNLASSLGGRSVAYHA